MPQILLEAVPRTVTSRMSTAKALLEAHNRQTTITIKLPPRWYLIFHHKPIHLPEGRFQSVHLNCSQKPGALEQTHHHYWGRTGVLESLPVFGFILLFPILVFERVCGSSCLLPETWTRGCCTEKAFENLCRRESEDKEVDNFWARIIERYMTMDFWGWLQFCITKLVTSLCYWYPEVLGWMTFIMDLMCRALMIPSEYRSRVRRSIVSVERLKLQTYLLVLVHMRRFLGYGSTAIKFGVGEHQGCLGYLAVLEYTNWT